MKNRALLMPWVGALAIAVILGLWLGRSQPTEAVTDAARASLTDIPQAGQNAGRAGRAPVQAEAVRPLFQPPVWGTARPPKVSAGAPPAASMVTATAAIGRQGDLDVTGLRRLGRVLLPLGDGRELAGVVNLVTVQTGGTVRAAGRLDNGGTFFLAQRPRGEKTGLIVLPSTREGYQLETRGGELLMHKRSLDSVLCEGMPFRHHPEAAATPAAAPPAPQAAAIPNLDSRPEATGVLYLDFDGETVTDPLWNGGSTIYAAPALMNGVAISTAQMADVWARVAEDFKPFKVTVTTVRSRYDNAPAGERMKAVITPTKSWYSSSVGGVAYISSYRGPQATYAFSDSIPCWVFNNYNTSDMALTVSHELGHTVGLLHDGLLDGTTYYFGHGSPPTSWGPIMGAPWDCDVTQWSIGDYRSTYSLANNQEDDLAIMGNLIGEPLGVPALPVDDAADDRTSAPPLNFDKTVNISGLISPHITGAVSRPDVDYYRLDTGGGDIALTANPGTTDPDLDMQMELRDSSNSLVLTSLPQDNLGATLNTTVAKGTYYVVVRGRARAGNGLYDYGYSAYGCNGPYTIKGTVPQLAVLPVITKQPLAQTVASGTKVVFSVTASSNVAATYQWYKDSQPVGKPGSTLTIASAQAGDAGIYQVTVTNAAGTATSDEVELVVRFKPSILTPPGPALTTVGAGGLVSYTVNAGGSTPLGYQWKKDGVVLPGAVMPTLDLGAVDWFDQGSYVVVVSNNLGLVTSAAVKLVVNSAPIIKIPPPAFKALLPGGAGSVAVTAVGPPALRYQWFKGPNAIPGATKPSYAWAAAGSAAEGGYTVQISNDFGTTTSGVVTVDVIDAPKITAQPQAAQTLASGVLLALSVTATGDANVPLNYQWQLNGVNIQGATGATYEVASVGWLNQGTYRVIVSNPAASVTSKNAVVTLHSPPVIMTPPAPMVKVARNGVGTLKVVAGGTPALAYQWKRNGTDIPGAKAATYTLSHAGDATVADYSVMVTNAYGSTPGGASHVVVEDAPAVSHAPMPLTKPVGGTATFDVTATGSPNLRYQWQKNNVNILGATASSLVLDPLALKDAASYRVLVANDVGTATSAAAKLTVQTPPTIAKQPLGQSVYEFDDVTFTGAGAGTATLRYQWQKDGVNIPGATGATLTLRAVRQAVDAKPTQEGDYTLVVTNTVGTATSDSAHLTITKIPTASLTMMTPYRGKVGAQVLLRGTNFRWTTKVTFNGKPATFIKANATELILTVPAGATTGPVVVTTMAGSVSTADAAALLSPIFTVTTKTENDDFENARFLTGKFYFLVGDSNVDATVQVAEPNFPGYSTLRHTIWYHWRPPVTSYYQIDTGGSPFNTFLAVFRGESLDKLSVVGYSGDIDIKDPHSSVGFVASKTEDYYIMVDGQYTQMSGLNPLPPLGELAFNLFMTLPTNDLPAGSEQKSAAASGAVQEAVPAPAVETSQETFVGGASATATRWLASDSESDLSTAETAHAALDLSIETTGTSTETFSWVVQDTAGRRLAGLVFDAAGKGVMQLAADGSVKDTGQVFVPGGEYHLDLQFDHKARTWGAMLNGTWIIEGEPLPAGTAFGRLGAAWTPGSGQSTGGRMRFSHTELTAETGL